MREVDLPRGRESLHCTPTTTLSSGHFSIWGSNNATIELLLTLLKPVTIVSLCHVTKLTNKERNTFCPFSSWKVMIDPAMTPSEACQAVIQAEPPRAYFISLLSTLPWQLPLLMTAGCYTHISLTQGKTNHKSKEKRSFQIFRPRFFWERKFFTAGVFLPEHLTCRDQ